MVPGFAVGIVEAGVAAVGVEVVEAVLHLGGGFDLDGSSALRHCWAGMASDEHVQGFLMELLGSAFLMTVGLSPDLTNPDFSIESVENNW